MTPAGEFLAAEIRRNGPVPFRRFMEVALYHPEHGYYRRARDPFGKHGDFFTAEQIQPVFGILMAARIRQLYRDGLSARVHRGGTGSGAARDGGGIRRVELRAGGSRFGRAAGKFRGVVFSNEFFDALPVDAAVYPATALSTSSAWRWRTARSAGTPAKWLEQRGAIPAPLLPAARRRPLVRSEPGGAGWLRAWPRVNQRIRAHRRLRLHARRERALSGGHADGIPAAHGARGRAGGSPGARHHGARQLHGARRERRRVRPARPSASRRWRRRCWPPESRPVRRRALGAGGAAEELRRRMQLKTLLFGMGETFRVLLQRKTKGEMVERTGGKALKQ
jgi:hypothetical protein